MKTGRLTSTDYTCAKFSQKRGVNFQFMENGKEIQMVVLIQQQLRKLKTKRRKLKTRPANQLLKKKSV